MHATIDKEDNPVDNGENLFVQQKSNGMVNKNYLLLDNQTTVNQIANPQVHQEVQQANQDPLQCWNDQDRP